MSGECAHFTLLLACTSTQAAQARLYKTHDTQGARTSSKVLVFLAVTTGFDANTPAKLPSTAPGTRLPASASSLVMPAAPLRIAANCVLCVEMSVCSGGCSAVSVCSRGGSTRQTRGGHYDPGKQGSRDFKAKWGYTASRGARQLRLLSAAHLAGGQQQQRELLRGHAPGGN